MLLGMFATINGYSTKTKYRKQSAQPRCEKKTPLTNNTIQTVCFMYSVTLAIMYTNPGPRVRILQFCRSTRYKLFGGLQRPSRNECAWYRLKVTGGLLLSHSAKNKNSAFGVAPSFLSCNSSYLNVLHGKTKERNNKKQGKS